MSKFNYPSFKILIDPQSKKTQGLRIGDVVRRQYFDHPKLIYSLMVVTETGVDVIGQGESAYFIGALIEGDEPKSGELLDFVRVTNLFDTARSGALYLTASDAEAPYMDVIDGMAVEKSLCYPYMGGGEADVPNMNKYACIGADCLETSYQISSEEASRIFRITRNKVNAGNKVLGMKQSLEKCPEHPARLLISYKIRASKVMAGIPLSFGYTDGTEMDGNDRIDIGTEWQYKLSLISVDYPVRYQRSLLLDLTALLTSEGDWCEIADLNIIRQSDISTFAGATKARVGKIKGVVDPIFGVLEGYGAYFQNLYATRNVNIAGTLTAGDENGFSSTFYVGKIHKNVILNSIACEFSDSQVVSELTPVGIGDVRQMGSDTRLKVQSNEWRDSHTDKKYCFSIWIKGTSGNVSVYQDEHFIQDIEVDCENEWKRYRVAFTVKTSLQPELSVWFKNLPGSLMVSAPQLEAGATPSQYQPTDGTLAYTEDYGAWFNKGGIGGTIQNPLLKLNEDGSISSRDRSFVINPDGTGHFASGRFTWTKDTITLQDITIKWEDLSEEAQENLSPVTLDIVSRSGLVVKNNSNDVDATAVLYRNGKELDTDGTEYIYTWKLWNAMGTAVMRTYTGKSIVVSKTDITSKGALTCEVSA
ncbi:hypothetical protein [Bacteroides sp.]|uniref:hypothetical protein n=1 Tax=Bacteroides sp. TaxID=29523 RepID=UPI002A81F2C2|nr:hypothetical protein [Bacteroides sp.]